MFPNFPQPGHSPGQPNFPQAQPHSPSSFPQPEQRSPAFPDAQQQRSGPAPQQLQLQHHAPPSSGFRVPLQSGSYAVGGGGYSPFPTDPKLAGEPPCRDADGVSPVYVGSAIFPDSVHPCKIAPHLTPNICRVPYGGTEYEHSGE